MLGFEGKAQSVFDGAGAAADPRREAFRARRGEPLSVLYVHVPFCPFRCAYCDFDLTTRRDAVDAYVAAIGREARAVGDLARPRAVFFGGGTPSLLAPSAFAALVAALARTVSFAEVSEWSLEANPETVTREKARVWRAAGVTRVSVGAQAFSDRRLAALGRPARAADIPRAWEILRAAGFDNLNLDLVFGIPGTDLPAWRADLAAALALAPEHVSVYALTVEEKTPLGLAVRRGAVSPVDEGLSARMYETAAEILAGAGLARYEVSNFARPERACRHNLAVWRGEGYLGFGSSAASFVGDVRGANVRGEARYRATLARAGSAFRVERTLDAAARMREKVLLGLRLAEGVAEKDVQAAGLSEEVARLAADGLLRRAGGRVVPTDRGFLFADETSAACV